MISQVDGQQFIHDPRLGKNWRSRQPMHLLPRATPGAVSRELPQAHNCHATTATTQHNKADDHLALDVGCVDFGSEL